jgi:hypothetical protein
VLNFLLNFSKYKTSVSDSEFNLTKNLIRTIPLPYRGNLSSISVPVTLKSVPNSYEKTAKQLFNIWTRSSDRKTVQLCGSDADVKQQIAAIALSDLSHSTGDGFAEGCC